MLISLGLYVNLYQPIIDLNKSLYYVFCATKDTAVAVALLRSHNFTSKADLLKWRKYNVNQYVSLLLAVLVLITIVQFVYREQTYTRELLNVTYIVIYSFAIFMLYLSEFVHGRINSRKNKCGFVSFAGVDTIQGDKEIVRKKEFG